MKIGREYAYFIIYSRIHPRIISRTTSIIPKIRISPSSKLRFFKMLAPTIIAGLVLGLSQVLGVVAAPVEDSKFVITHVASDYFPNAKGDLKKFDVDVQYIGYSAKTQSWLTSLDPSAGSTDKEKAMMLTEAAYAKPYDENDADMAADVQAMLDAVAGMATPSIEKRSSFSLDAGHAIHWASCAGVFSCLSGTTCAFNLDVGKAPRSACQSQGGSNCCISWSNYNVRVGFFTTTWTSCNSEVQAEQKSDVSCEGHGSDGQGGDVCLSNRANGCT